MTKSNRTFEILAILLGSLFFGTQTFKAGAALKTGAGAPAIASFLLLLLGTCALAGTLVYAVLSARSRGGALAALALDLGLAFEKDGPDAGPLLRTGLPIFGKVSEYEAKNMLLPPDHTPWEKVLFFDFRVDRLDSRGRRSMYPHTVALFELAGPALPVFIACPDNLAMRAAEAVGVINENFEKLAVPGAPGFSSEIRLSGPDKQALLSFFRQPVAEFLLARPGWHIQSSGSLLLLYRDEGLVPVRGYPEFMERAAELAGFLLSSSVTVGR